MLFWVLYEVMRETAHGLLLCHGSLLIELPLKRADFVLQIVLGRQISNSFILQIAELFAQFVDFCILHVDLSDEVVICFVLVNVILGARF